MEAPGAYGSRFQGVPIAFDVVEESDTEDHYVITLSFRPQGAFAGSPGQEQFYIEKEGTVAVRQVRALPRPERGRRLPVLPIVVALVLLIAGAGVAAVFASGGLGGRDGESSYGQAVLRSETPGSMRSRMKAVTGLQPTTRDGTPSRHCRRVDAAYRRSSASRATPGRTSTISLGTIGPTSSLSPDEKMLGTLTSA